MPTIAEEIEGVQQDWAEVAATRPRAEEHPGRCACDEPRVVWDGVRHRTASVRISDEVVFIADLPCRRLWCGTCETGWTRRPPGVLPRRHYLPCVVAEAVAEMAIGGATTAATAERFGVDRRTLGRWTRWTAHVAEPAVLQRELLEATDEPIVVGTPSATLRREPQGTARSVHARAAQVLALCVALASALSLPPPELGAVVARYAGPLDGVTTDRAPAIEALSIPDDARGRVR